MGVDLDWNLSFFGYSQYSNSLGHQICISDFKGFVDQNPITNCLFPFLSGLIRLKGRFLISSTESILIREFRRYQHFSHQDKFYVVEFWHYSANIPRSDVDHFGKIHC